MNLSYHSSRKKREGLRWEVQCGTDLIGTIQKQVWRFAFYERRGDMVHLALAHDKLEILKAMIEARFSSSPHKLTASGPLIH